MTNIPLPEALRPDTLKDFVGQENLAEKDQQKLTSSPIVFLDEIHRFNKAQQDKLLPHVEKGDIILIGATTENPSFEVIGPLMSRSRVLVVNQLNNKDLKTIIRRGLRKLKLKI